MASLEDPTFDPWFLGRMLIYWTKEYWAIGRPGNNSVDFTAHSSFDLMLYILVLHTPSSVTPHILTARSNTAPFSPVLTAGPGWGRRGRRYKEVGWVMNIDKDNSWMKVQGIVSEASLYWEVEDLFSYLFSMTQRTTTKLKTFELGSRAPLWISIVDGKQVTVLCYWVGQ